MLYVISQTQSLDKVWFVKADTMDEAHKMVGVEVGVFTHRLLTDEEVNVLARNDVVLIRA